MAKFAIHVEGLGKQYQIGRTTLRSKTIREGISENLSVARLKTILQARQKPASETIWALRDITFSVSPGELVGIIGSNGAGKSTLLKILSNITEPTEGFIDL